LVAVLPMMLTRMMGVPPTAAQFFGGTGLLIMVGVLLDIMRQVETHLLQRNYDGFLRKGKIKGRYDKLQNTGDRVSNSTMLYLLIFVAILVIVGVSYWIYNG